MATKYEHGYGSFLRKKVFFPSPCIDRLKFAVVTALKDMSLAQRNKDIHMRHMIMLLKTMLYVTDYPKAW